MIERRFVEGEALEIEERSGGNPKIRGRAIVYNSHSRDLGGFREVIEPGAFDHILARQKPKVDVVALFNHDASQLLGRSTAGTLKLWSDERGVMYEIDPLPNTALARDLLEHIRLGNIRGSSFAFAVDEGGERYDVDEETGAVTRYVSRASGLFDVSPVTSPAYEASAVSVRSFEAWQESRKPAEEPAPPAAPKSSPSLRHAIARAKATLVRGALLIVAVLVLADVAEARPRRRSGGSSYSGVPAGHSNATAQAVADACAADGRLAHRGGNTGYEGLGMGPTQEAAYRSCCYANSGMSDVDVGYAQMSNGMWICCRRYR